MATDKHGNTVEVTGRHHWIHTHTLAAILTAGSVLSMFGTVGATAAYDFSTNVEAKPEDLIPKFDFFGDGHWGAYEYLLATQGLALLVGIVSTAFVGWKGPKSIGRDIVTKTPPTPQPVTKPSIFPNVR